MDLVQSCKIVSHFSTLTRALYTDGEYGPSLSRCSPGSRRFLNGIAKHHGRHGLLPFHPEQTDWVRTHGRIPQGRRPVEGGNEWSGVQLYHAHGTIEAVDVPGKTNEHLGGNNFPFGDGEHAIQDGYHILVWHH